MNYQVPQHINKDKIFIVNRSTIDNRLDAQYYSADLDLSGFVKLSSVAIVKGGKRIPKGYGYSNEQTPYHYLRVADMDSNAQVEVNNLMNISEEVFNILERYEILEGELAISIAGTIGKTTILKNIPIDKRVILTENCAKVLAKTNVDLLPEYLKICLELPIVKKQLDLNYIQTTIPKLGLDKIVGIKIPPIPCIQKQQEIVDYINEAYIQKRVKEVESQQLLDSIDGYLLKELGITIPSVDDGLKNRIFLSSFSKIEGNRIDPKYNKQIRYFQESYDSNTWKTLSSVSIVKGQYGANEAAIAYQEGDTRYIRITDIDEIGNLKNEDKKTAQHIDDMYLLHNGDILFARSGSVGKCYLHRDKKPSIFAGYLIRFVLNDKIILPKFLFYYCNSSLYWYWVDTIHRPAVQANINAEEYCKMPIPVPSINKQQEIVNYIADIRTRAKALQTEGKAILEDAKRKVEEMIIK
ncbi:MAG: restriction endonuclease subunit S [Bacteroidales bacterium]|nr:restriction endonuclease subunit S [Bacteroidales bacterium]